MSHKTMIGGTAYHTQGGRAMAGGTVYAVQSGRVMAEGTVWNVSFGAPSLRLGQDNPCGASVTLEDNGQVQLGVSGAPKDETAAGWLELARNGVLLRLQPGDEVEFSCRVSRLGDGSVYGVTFFTDPEAWESTALAVYDKEVNNLFSGTHTVTQPCYVRVWAKLTGSGTPFQNIKLALLSFRVNGEDVAAEF